MLGLITGASVEDLIEEIQATSQGPFPPRLSCFIKKYEACYCNDYSQCSSPLMRTMMSHIVELADTHPRYEVDEGEFPTVLFGDIGIVAWTAVHQQDDINESIAEFLEVALVDAQKPMKSSSMH